MTRLFRSTALLALTSATVSLAGLVEPSSDPLPVPEALRETFEDGWIDWSDGVVAALGRARIFRGQKGGIAVERTRIEALFRSRARLLEIVGEVRLDGEGLLRDREGALDRIRPLVEGATLVREKRRHGPSLEILVTVPLRGERGLFTALAAPETGDAAGAVTAVDAGGAEDGLEPTGVILDARGLGLLPSLFPRILDAGGKALWSRDLVDPTSMKKVGLASFHLSSRVRPPGGGDKPGAFHYRTGARPVRIRASGAAGPLKTDLLLDAEATERVRGSETIQRLLHECRVVILTD